MHLYTTHLPRTTCAIIVLLEAVDRAGKLRRRSHQLSRLPTMKSAPGCPIQSLNGLHIFAALFVSVHTS